MFHIQLFFTRISYHKPCIIMPNRDILFASFNSREVIRGYHLTQYFAQLLHQWGFGADN